MKISIHNALINMCKPILKQYKTRAHSAYTFIPSHMAYRDLVLEIKSAQNLRKVHTASLWRKMKPFALVSIRDNNDDLKSSEEQTRIDKEGDINPTWNFHVTFSIDITRAVENQHTLVVKLKSRRKSSERDVGEVRVQITDLEGFGDANDVAERHLSKDVVNSYGTSQQREGTLNFSYRFGSTGQEAQDPPASTVNTGNHETPNVPPRRHSAAGRLLNRVTKELGVAAIGVAASTAFGAVLDPFSAESSDQPDANNGAFSGGANGG